MDVGSNFMKTLLLATILILTACQETTKRNLVKENKADNTVKTISKDTVDKAKFYTEEDTLIIATLNQDTLKYSQSDFNEIVDYFPALYSKYPHDPDQTFRSSEPFKEITDNNGSRKTISFSAETGQDAYYVLYTYFLRKHFNLDKYNTQRQKLTKIYNNINAIYSRLNFGGTYFRHQYSRIAGYAEYAIYLYSTDQEFYDRTYDIAKQKELYINSLRQFVKDELTVENRFNEGVISSANKKQLETDLYKLIGDIRLLITDYFYLSNAQSFQYAHY